MAAAHASKPRLFQAVVRDAHLRALGRRLPALAAAAFVAQADAQLDYSGTWSIVPEQAPAGDAQAGEFVGLPLNEAALRRASSWDRAIQSLPIWQCRPLSGTMTRLNAANFRLTQIADAISRDIVALQIEWSGSNDLRVFLDGRGHPPSQANHSWNGYSTGRAADRRLQIRTTHLKDGYYRSNGSPQSDRAELTEFVIRRRFRDQDYLTWIVIADDPVYLSEPLVRSSDYRRDSGQRITPVPCSTVRPANGTGAEVPSFVPGTNDQLEVFPSGYGLPPRILADGAATLYPDYRGVLEDWRERAQPAAADRPASER